MKRLFLRLFIQKVEEQVFEPSEDLLTLFVLSLSAFQGGLPFQQYYLPLEEADWLITRLFSEWPIDWVDEERFFEGEQEFIQFSIISIVEEAAA